MFVLKRFVFNSAFHITMICSHSTYNRVERWGHGNGNYSFLCFAVIHFIRGDNQVPVSIQRISKRILIQSLNHSQKNSFCSEVAIFYISFTSEGGSCCLLSADFLSHPTIYQDLQLVLFFAASNFAFSSSSSSRAVKRTYPMIRMGEIAKPTLKHTFAYSLIFSRSRDMTWYGIVVA